MGATVLRPKMCALALMELAFRKPKKQRRLTFAEIADHCRVGPKEVEFLVMKAMCANLIKGQIDEVEALVMVTWVKPRILDFTRIDLIRFSDYGLTMPDNSLELWGLEWPTTSIR